jgi:hypothetical protein
MAVNVTELDKKNKRVKSSKAPVGARVNTENEIIHKKFNFAL